MRFAVVLLCGGLVFGVARAEAPPFVNFQGKLTDASGVPVADGSYNLRFRIYSAATGDAGDPCAATCVWEELQSVSTLSGNYNVLLGSVSPLTASVFGGAERYIGVRIGADSEMVPRRRVASVPYALTSGSDAPGTAGTVIYSWGGLDGDQNFSTSSPTTPGVAPVAERLPYAYVAGAGTVGATFERVVLKSKFKKVSGSDTVTAYGLVSMSSDWGSYEAGFGIDIGGRTAAADQASSSATPEWLSTSVDVSSLIDGQVYDLHISVRKAVGVGNSAEHANLYSIVLFAGP